MGQYSNEPRTIVIPDGTTVIGHSAFCRRDFVEEVIIPEGVHMICNDAFYYCKNLKRVQLPSTLTEICDGVFTYCRALEEINLPEGLKKIGENAFRGCEALRGLTLPSTLTGIGKNAFHSVALGDVQIPAAMKTVGASAFENAIVQTVDIPATVKSIGRSAFAGSGLTQVTFHEGLGKIGEKAFATTNLTEVRLPESLTELDGRAFEYCEKLQKLNLPAGLKTLSRTIFHATPLAKTQTQDGWLILADNKPVYTIPGSIRKVAEGAFANCVDLEELHIPGHQVDMESVWLGFKKWLLHLNRLSRIHAPEYTLEECPAQLAPYIQIGWLADHWNGKPLAADMTAVYSAVRASIKPETAGLWKWLLLSSRDALYDAIKGQALPLSLVDDLLEKNPEDKELIFALLDYKNSLRETEPAADALELMEEIPQPDFLSMTKKEAAKLWTVKLLDDGTWRVSAYKGTDPVMTIPAYIDDLPVTEVGKSPKASYKVQEVHIPDTVTTLAASAFQDFAQLHTLTIGKGVTTIGSKAFMGCSKLTHVELPPKLVCIPHWLFAGCGKLEVLKITGAETMIEADANFLRSNRKAVLWIHRGNTRIMEYLSDSKRKVEFL